MTRLLCWIGWHKWELVVANMANREKEIFDSIIYGKGILKIHSYKCSRCGKVRE